MTIDIQELSRKAKAKVPHGLGVDKWIEVYNEKFAELIVRECADVVSNQYSADWGKWSNRMILEHFGVEE